MRESIARLFQPGQPPVGWVVRTILILGGTLAFIVALSIAGIVMRGDAGRGFGERRPGTMASVAMILWGAAMALRLWWWNGSGVSRWFWLAAAAGLALLAADDRYQFHEQAAVRLHDVFQWDQQILSTQTLDGILVGLYGIAAVLLGWVHRRELIRLPWFTWSIFAAGGFFGAMVLLDVLDWGGNVPEEGSKLMGAACIVCAFYGALYDPAAVAAVEPAAMADVQASRRSTAMP